MIKRPSGLLAANCAPHRRAVSGEGDMKDDPRNQRLCFFYPMRLAAIPGSS
jgi:hypothetical protein